MKKGNSCHLAGRVPVLLLLAAFLLLAGCAPMKPMKPSKASFTDRTFRYQDPYGGFSVVLPDQMQIIPTRDMLLDPGEVPLLVVSNHPQQFYAFGYHRSSMEARQGGFSRLADRFEARMEENLKEVKARLGIHNIQFLNYRRAEFQDQPALYWDLSGTEVIGHLSMPTHGSLMIFVRGDSAFSLLYWVLGDTLEEAEQLFHDMATEREKTYNSFKPLNALE